MDESWVSSGVGGAVVCSDMAPEADWFCGSHESSNALSNVRLGLHLCEVQIETIL